MNTYQISPIANSFIKGKCFLPTEKKRVVRILNSGFDVDYTADWVYPSLSKNLTRMTSQIVNNQLEIVYHREHKTQKKMSDITRAKADACISAGDTARDVRAGLWGDTCYDFDMCCAHHALILSALKQDEEIDIDCQFPTLNEYVNNKKAFRRDVAKVFDDDLRKAKDAICAITFGSSLKNAFKDANQTSYPKSCILLRDELAKFTELVVSANPDYAKVVEKEVAKRNKKELTTFLKKFDDKTADDAKKLNIGVKNWKHTMMSEWCCNKEAICMEAVIKFADQKGIIQGRRFDNSKDGVMIPKADVLAYVEREGLEVADIPALFRDVVNEIGFAVDYEEKPMDDDHTSFWKTIEACEKDVPFTPKHCKVFDKAYFAELDKYVQKKKYWELFFAQIDELSCYVYTMSTPEKDKHGHIRFNRKMVYYSKKNLTDMFGNLKSNIYGKNFAGETINKSFLGEWFKEDCLRSYQKIDNLPYAGVYDPHRCTAEVMNAFVGYPEHIWGGDVNYSDDKMWKTLQPFFLVLANLVGEKDVGYKGIDIKSWDDLAKFKHMQHLLAVMGHRIARPDEPRYPYTPVIHGVQGTAKNVCMNVFGSMVGDEHYICTSNPEDFFSTHAEGFVGKLITVMNELDLSGSAKQKNKMKGIISEDTAVCNRKFVAPFKYAVVAIAVILSNERCPIVLEMNSNRRYMIQRCNDTLAKKFSQKHWKQFVEHFQSTEFLRCLRQFLTQFDYDSFDYTEALRHNHNSPAYKQMLSHFFPADLRFFKALIEEQWFHSFTPDASKAFYEHPSWNKEVSMLSSELQGNMLKFFEEENQAKSIEKYKQKQRFNNHIADLQLPITKVAETRKPVKWSFTPKTMYQALIEKGLVDADTLDDATLSAVGEVVKESEDIDFGDMFA